MKFGRKHIETGPSYSNKVVTFFMYHMPLIQSLISYGHEFTGKIVSNTEINK